MKTIELKNKEINIDAILEEYCIDTSIFSEMDDRLIEIYPKWEALNKSDKILIVLYANCGNYRDVGDILGISHTTIARFIKKIRKKLW